MSRPPMNPRGGEAVIVKARMPDQDVVRLIRLATRRRTTRSAVLREAVSLALDQMEKEAAVPP